MPQFSGVPAGSAGASSLMFIPLMISAQDVQHTALTGSLPLEVRQQILAQTQMMQAHHAASALQMQAAAAAAPAAGMHSALASTFTPTPGVARALAQPVAAHEHVPATTEPAEALLERLLSSPAVSRNTLLHHQPTDTQARAQQNTEQVPDRTDMAQNHEQQCRSRDTSSHRQPSDTQARAHRTTEQAHDRADSPQQQRYGSSGGRDTHHQPTDKQARAHLTTERARDRTEERQDHPRLTVSNGYRDTTTSHRQPTDTYVRAKRVCTPDRTDSPLERNSGSRDAPSIHRQPTNTQTRAQRNTQRNAEQHRSSSEQKPHERNQRVRDERGTSSTKPFNQSARDAQQQPREHVNESTASASKASPPIPAEVAAKGLSGCIYRFDHRPQYRCGNIRLDTGKVNLLHLMCMLVCFVIIRGI